ncbi:hypothetical protein DH2020_016843 [Rehmannia glutinosa]|uniref:SURP motif domain-containing protein n=1 Tax=Rehmannia glutinosa TaxID=99300 RepID=A0ABR0WP41_REHGL
MDLEVVGRHALLFDDDAAAAFVNSGDALVDWHSLQIDRYDVRHLLSSPLPPRRRNRNSEPILWTDLSLESQLDHERYFDLPSHSDQPDVEEDEHRTDSLGYRAVAFSYGYTDDSADKKNTDAGMESSGFLPRFPIPSDVQSLPPTEKVHQIIARTAMFVSKNGGQSEIILRVKQGDNPTFGFLMPGHHLHAYFRFLVEHPEVLHSESDGKPQDEQKKSGGEHNESNGVDGALTLLGSVYGSGEEEEGDNDVKPEKDVSQDGTHSLNRSISHSSKKIESQADAAKDEPLSKNPILSNKEKVLTVKKNSLITASKSGTAKGMEEKSCLFSTAADKAKSLIMGTTKIEPVILEPPPELKRLIDKIIEFITRNGKQFEATLIEQDSMHGRFPFLLPSNQYHSYYLKVLQTAQESKLNCKSSTPGKDDLPGRGMDKRASVLKENDFLSLASDMPLESDRKEKFKMVIGKSKKETHETESKEAQQECGIDAAATAALLQAATRGIKNSNSQTISTTSQSAHVHANGSEGGQHGTVAPNTVASTVAVEADSEAHLTKEQRLKAERLKRAKMFVAMLKSGEVPFTAGTSRGSSLEPLESGVSMSAGEVNLECKEREASLAPAGIDRPATGEKPERNYFGEEHTERLSKRKYRSRSVVCEDDDEDDDRDKKEHNGHHSKRNCRSRSKRHDENDNAVETERKHHRRRHRTHSSSDENEDEGESSEENRGNKRHKSKHRSHHQHEEEDKYKEDKNHKSSTRKKHHRRRHRTHSSSEENEDEGESSEEHRNHKHYKEDKNHKRTRQKHRSHRSHEHSSKKRLSEQYLLVEDDEHDDYERDEKRSERRHRSHRSSHRSRDKHRHIRGRSSRDKESQCKLKHDTCPGYEHQNHSCMDKSNYDERIELEEGEISSRVSEEPRGIANGDVSLETSIDVLSSQQRVPSQPPETTAEVPDDLRAKIRAMLMSTRL